MTREILKPRIVFFGTPEFSVKILEALKDASLMPILIVTGPDKPKGRKMLLSPSPVKRWAQKHQIPIQHDYAGLKEQSADLFVIASFGKILPKEILEIPKRGTINVHPSLLPELRGPSPIQSAILENHQETGVTIMLVTARVDAGPIIAQKKLRSFKPASLTFPKLEEELANLGGKLLVSVIPKWILGKIEPKPQDENRATYTRKITKKDGEIDWTVPPELIERKIRALNPWPGTYAFNKNGKRIIITKARFNRAKKKLEIIKVKPEGKTEMSYQDYLKGNPPLFKP
jgi:methionyl-tRNA formyltransferase